MPIWAIALFAVAIPIVIMLVILLFGESERGKNLFERTSSRIALFAALGLFFLWDGARDITGPAGSSFVNAPKSVDVGFGILYLAGGLMLLYTSRDTWRKMTR
jgi:hypothetical protein